MMSAMRSEFRSLRFAFLLVCLSASAATVNACTCAAPPDPLVSMARSEAVFTGTPVACSPSREDEFAWHRARQLAFTFLVETAWKGALGDTVVVRTESQASTCSFLFELGDPYLVYCYGDPESLHTGLCTRTRPLGEAGGDTTAFRSIGVTGEPERVDARILDLFIADLASLDSTLRKEALGTLWTIGSRVPSRCVPPLVRHYELHRGAERALAVGALGSLRPHAPELDSLFEAAMVDSEASVRGAALLALARLDLPPDQFLEIIDRGLADPAAENRSIALGRMKYLVDHRATPDDVRREITHRAIVALRDPNVRVRMSAAWALPESEVVSPEERRALLGLARDPAPEARQIGIGKLRTLARDEEIQLILLTAARDTSETVRSSAAATLSDTRSVTDESIEALLMLARDRSAQVSDSAIRGLMQMSETMPDLCQHLPSFYDRAMESTRFRMLSHFHDHCFDPPSALALSRSALRDENARLRERGVGFVSIVEGHDSEVMKLLEFGLSDDEPRVRVAALRVAGRRGDRAGPLVSQIEKLATSDAQPSVRSAASEALRKIGGNR